MKAKEIDGLIENPDFIDQGSFSLGAM